MPRTVIVLRHAEPQVQADLSPAEWSLNSAGREAAALLGEELLADAFLASSGEAKAAETMRLAAGVAGASIYIDDRFGEVRRPGEPFDDNHRVRRRAWVEGRLDERHETWETPAHAGQRFQQGIDAIDADRVAVATHGMVLTAWLVTISHVEVGSAAGEFWTDLKFPDVLTLRI